MNSKCKSKKMMTYQASILGSQRFHTHNLHLLTLEKFAGVLEEQSFDMRGQAMHVFLSVL